MLKRIIVVLVTFGLIGCSSTRPQPNFNIDTETVQGALNTMAQDPMPLERPLVILSGWCNTGARAMTLKRQFQNMTSGPDICVIAFPLHWTFDRCYDRLIEKINTHFPSADPNGTVQVDVIAHSMGGLIARYAALPRPGRCRLNMCHLFTIATPHRGTPLAHIPMPDQRVGDMRPGSAFLVELDRHLGACDYDLICYLRMGDSIVKPASAAPAGHPLWLVPCSRLGFPHGRALNDPRIMADIAWRLRNETPLIQRHVD